MVTAWCSILLYTCSDFELDVQVSLKAGQPDGETPQDPDRKTPRDSDGETPGDPDREPDKESKMTDRSLKVDLTDAEKTRNPSTAESSIDLLSVSAAGVFVEGLFSVYSCCCCCCLCRMMAVMMRREHIWRRWSLKATPTTLGTMSM